MITIVPCKEMPKEKEDKIIYVPNEGENDSMAKKLNRGIEIFLRKYPTEKIVCIRHDDAYVRTDPSVVEWQIRQLTDNHKVGAVGLIGCCQLYDSCTWWAPNRKINAIGAIKQGGVRQKTVNGLKLYTKKDNKPVMEEFEYPMIEKLGVCDYAATVDGCCMWFPRWIFEEGMRYDENLKDYHFYDADICLQVLARGYKVATNTNIEVMHKSVGEMPDYFNELKKNFYTKWSILTDNHWPISRNTKFKDYNLLDKMIKEQYGY